MTDPLKFSIGYQLPDRDSIAELVLANQSRIGEVYFPWLGVPDGRGVSICSPNDQAEMEEELYMIADAGIKLNLLWNANCYGDQAISVNLADTVRSAIGYLKKEINLSILTTTSLFVAEVAKKSFPDIEIRASVNMAIGSLEGMRYVSSYFDSFYLKRELNRDLNAIRTLKESGKKIYLLANSGCLRNCSAHTFHDNLVAHEKNAARYKNEWPGFRGVCWPYYSDRKNHLSFLTDTTWIRPEDVHSYEGLVDGIKLATRTNLDPRRVIEAYVKESFDGNMLTLCEPDFSGLAEIRNKSFPADWLENALDHDYCARIFPSVYRKPSVLPFF